MAIKEQDAKRKRPGLSTSSSSLSAHEGKPIPSLCPATSMWPTEAFLNKPSTPLGPFRPFVMSHNENPTPPINQQIKLNQERSKTFTKPISTIDIQEIDMALTSKNNTMLSHSHPYIPGTSTSHFIKLSLQTKPIYEPHESNQDFHPSGEQTPVTFTVKFNPPSFTLPPPTIMKSTSHEEQNPCDDSSCVQNKMRPCRTA